MLVSVFRDLKEVCTGSTFIAYALFSSLQNGAILCLSNDCKIETLSVIFNYVHTQGDGSAFRILGDGTYFLSYRTLAQNCALANQNHWGSFLDLNCPKTDNTNYLNESSIVSCESELKEKREYVLGVTTKSLQLKSLNFSHCHIANNIIWVNATRSCNISFCTLTENMVNTYLVSCHNDAQISRCVFTNNVLTQDRTYLYAAYSGNHKLQSCVFKSNTKSTVRALNGVLLELSACFTDDPNLVLASGVVSIDWKGSNFENVHFQMASYFEEFYKRIMKTGKTLTRRSTNLLSLISFFVI